MQSLTPFHLAIPVHDLQTAQQFYGQLLGCEEGRSSNDWVDYNFFGHQLVCHCVADYRPPAAHNPVDGHAVPIPHFGVVLEMADWKALRERLQQASVEFLVEPHIRFEGQAGEQATLFLRDPSGNAVEFKGLRDIGGELFKK